MRGFRKSRLTALAESKLSQSSCNTKLLLVRKVSSELKLKNVVLCLRLQTSIKAEATIEIRGSKNKY